MSSSSRPSKAAWSDASWFWIWAVAGAALYEITMLAMGRVGGALSHVVWAAMGESYTWRWALVGAPIVGLLTWCIPHFLWQWGTGTHLLAIIGAWLVVLAALVLAR